VLAILLSGALAGLAGVSLTLAAETPGMTDNFGSDYGFQGIAVALLARNSPVGAIPAALLFAALRQGGGVMEAQVGVSASLVGITQGIVIMFVLAAAALLYLARHRSRVSTVVADVPPRAERGGA
jgi:simple sugar transport system permease protein